MIQIQLEPNVFPHARFLFEFKGKYFPHPPSRQESLSFLDSSSEMGEINLLKMIHKCEAFFIFSQKEDFFLSCSKKCFLVEKNQQKIRWMASSRVEKCEVPRLGELITAFEDFHLKMLGLAWK